MTSHNPLPYQLFANPDERGDLRLVFDDGDHIIQVTVSHGRAELDEVDSVPGDWVQLGAQPAGLVLSLARLEAWAGRPVTARDIARLDAMLGESSVPGAFRALFGAIDIGDVSQPHKKTSIARLSIGERCGHGVCVESADHECTAGSNEGVACCMDHCTCQGADPVGDDVGVTGHTDGGDEGQAVYRHVRHWAQTGEIIPDGVARTIAAWWQSSMDVAMASLATSGAIDVDRLRTSIGVELAEEWEGRADADVQRAALHALRAYASEHGDRGPVPGWVNVWATR